MTPLWEREMMLSTPSLARLAQESMSPELYLSISNPPLLMKSGRGLIASFSTLNSLSLERKMLPTISPEGIIPVSAHVYLYNWS